MSDKPKMYRIETGKEFHNNRSIYASYSDKYNDDTVNIYNTNEIRKKINDLFSSPNFIYRTKVNIVVDNQVLTKKVVGVYNNNLVTIDNEHIPINLIKNIYK